MKTRLVKADKIPLDPIKLISHIPRQELIGILGDKASVSKILNKKRKLTLGMIRKLYEVYNISLDGLIVDYDLN